MATNFSVTSYLAQLQALLTAQGVAVTVKGLAREADGDKHGAARRGVELQIDDFPCDPTGAFRELHGTLTATLLCTVCLDDDASEAQAFELALDVATALTDEGQAVAGGPIVVTGIQPEALDVRAGARLACYAVGYQQELTIRRTNQITEPLLQTAYVARDPTDSDPDNYEQVVPDPEA